MSLKEARRGGVGAASVADVAQNEARRGGRTVNARSCSTEVEERRLLKRFMSTSSLEMYPFPSLLRRTILSL